MVLSPLPHFKPVAEKYAGFFVDLWGVVHDGTALYPGARECLEQLRALHKKVVFISNAPRRAAKAEEVLIQLGITKDYYDAIITSGEVAYLALEAGSVRVGKRYAFIGPDRDAGVLDGLSYIRTDSLQDAEFLLNVGFGSEQTEMGEYTKLLTEAAAKRLPMLCLNPDREVVKITGERFACAGVIAEQYANLGGDVIWFGKPYPDIYRQALALCAPLAAADILAIGDGLFTDIAGARAANITSVLVTGGILSHNLSVLETTSHLPDYTMASWNW